jgi:hypothetical protein
MISRFCALLTLGLATVVPSMFATTYTGSDKACFGLGSCSTVSGTMSYGLSDRDLSFTTATINQVGNGDVKLGTFHLGTNPALLFAGTFDLDVNFSAPPGVNGTGDYDAWEIGSVGFNKDGWAVVSFTNPTTQSFTYPGGSFSLKLDQSVITLCAGGSVDLMGTITGTSAAPEPTAMLLLGSGLGLLGLVRFRKTAKQQVS